MPNTYVRHAEDRKPQKGAQSHRVPVARWIDSFPGIQGSSIEKMVMAELVRRGIYFEHTPQTNSLGGFVDPTWEPDFLFPQYHIWMEIQGAYFHTLPGAIERDSLRFAIIEAAGWKPIFLWEADIRTRLVDILDAIPQFYRVNKNVNKKAAKVFGVNVGIPFLEGGSVTGSKFDPKTGVWKNVSGTGGDLAGSGLDHLKGLRAALSARARPPQKLKIKRRRKRRPK